MLFYIPSIGKRVNESQLSRMGLLPESAGVYVLVNQQPNHHSIE